LGEDPEFDYLVKFISGKEEMHPLKWPFFKAVMIAYQNKQVSEIKESIVQSTDPHEAFHIVDSDDYDQLNEANFDKWRVILVLREIEGHVASLKAGYSGLVKLLYLRFATTLINKEQYSSGDIAVKRIIKDLVKLILESHSYYFNKFGIDLHGARKTSSKKIAITTQLYRLNDPKTLSDLADEIYKKNQRTRKKLIARAESRRRDFL